MSALRKLRQLKLNQTEAESAAAPATSTTSTAGNESNTKKDDSLIESKPKSNTFSMLMEDEEEEQDAEEETVAVSTSNAPSVAIPSSSPPSATNESDPVTTSSVASGSKKQQSKPAKKSAAPKSKSKSNAKATPAAATNEKEEWELEFASEESKSNTLATSSASSTSSSSSSNLWSCLQTESKLLDSQQEIRSIFGGRMDRRTLEEDQTQDAAHGGMNRGGFRRGGALARRLAGGGIGARAAAASKRLLIRPNPNWPRTEERGLIKMEFVPRMQPPTPPKAKKATAAASGMHGNIHSISTASSTATSTSSSTTEEKESPETREYITTLERYQSQQLLALTPGSRQYAFIHSRDFERIQQEYLSSVASHDVHILSYFARSHPFHPEAALTMSDIFAAQSEYTTSHEFVQRVLHVYENAFTTEFQAAVQQGQARLDADRVENLPFFTALAKHAQTLGKKGCPRTALEVCKLLLSLSPLQDPMGTLFAIDYYALRAKQWAFLVNFSAELDRAVMAAYGVGAHPWTGKREEKTTATPTSATNVATITSSPASATSTASTGWTQPVPRAPCTFLPNLMYSRALAAWYQETEGSTATATDKSKKKATSTSATSATGASTLFTGLVSPPTLPASASGHSMIDADEVAFVAPVTDPAATSSSYLLQQSMLMWPSVLKPLLEAAGAENAANRSGGPWARALETLNGLYAGSFLSSATAAPASTPYLAKLELIFSERSGSLFKNDKIQTWLLANAEALAAAINAKKYSSELLQKFTDARMKYLLSVPFPAAVKSLQKSSYSDHVPHLPPELLMAQNQQQFDPAGERARQTAAQMQAAGYQPLNLQQHPMRVFLQSLLPWFVAPNGEQQQQVGEGGLPIPANIEEAVGRLNELPAEQREEMLRQLMQQVEAEEQEELDAAINPEERQGGDGAAGGINYADYQFEDEEEENEQNEQHQ